MKILCIHQNFPGQFRQLAPFLLERGHDLKAICSHTRPTGVACEILRYSEPASLDHPHPGLGSDLWAEALQRAESVAHRCAALKLQGWEPDRICAHSGWGETLGVREIWPDVPQLIWPELWLQPIHGGHGVDPQKSPDDLSARLQLVGRNALTRVALTQANAWVLPTEHQAKSFPPEFQNQRLHVIHEGINTDVAKPCADINFEVRDNKVDRSTPTITFVNRNLERLRGFDVFMHALPQILRSHPTVRVLIVGDDQAGYGGIAGGRQRLLSQLGDQLDFDRIHFLGRIPHPHLIGLLQASWVHVYLSYPFILGWSLLEAMACGCCIVGSRGFPVEEVIADGVEGLLVPMHDSNRLAKRVLTLLNAPELRDRFGRAARLKAMQWDQRRVLPKLADVVEQLHG